MELKFLRSIWTGANQPLGGHYKVIQQLGAGGFGQTFLAQDLHLPGQPLCVVKQLKPQAKSEKELRVARRLFDTEAKVLYQLGIHPQIPRLLAHFEDNGEFYLAQELIEGNDLSDEIAGAAPWSDTQVVAFLGDVLATLAFVHHHRVIHRDLKPSNLIRRQQDQRIVLIDFGAVKQASTQLISDDTGVSHTISIGTQGYMPNEQIAGMPQFSSDIYALGIMGIQLLTGRHPRTLTPDPRTGELDWQCYVPHVDPDLVAVLERMVRYDFRSRYATAAEALSALQSLPEQLVKMIPPSLSAPSYPNPEPRPAAATATPPPLPSRILPLPTSGPEPASLSPAVFAIPQTVPETAGITAKEARTGRMAGTGPTFPVMGQAARTTRNLSASVPKTRFSVATELVTQLKTVAIAQPKVMMSAVVAMVTILGMGLLIGRSLGPTAVESTQPTPETASTKPSPSAVAPPTPALSPSPSPESTQPEPTVEAKPSNSATLVAVANSLKQAEQLKISEQYAEAIALYDTVIAQSPDNPATYVEKCYSLNQLQRFDEAIVTCDQALELDPNNPQALWSKGYGTEQQGNHSAALQLYNMAIQQDPGFAAAWNNKGTALLALGQSQEAVAAFDEAIALDPNLAAAWNNRGAALWNLRQFSQALASVNRALEMQPNYPEASQLRQEMKQRLGQ